VATRPATKERNTSDPLDQLRRSCRFVLPLLCLLREECRTRRSRKGHRPFRVREVCDLSSHLVGLHVRCRRQLRPVLLVPATLAAASDLPLAMVGLSGHRGPHRRPICPPHAPRRQGRRAGDHQAEA